MLRLGSLLAIPSLLVLLAGATPGSAQTAFTESVGVLYAIDPNSGEAETLGSTGVEERLSTLALDPAGRLFGIGRTSTTETTLFELDAETGMARRIGELGFDGFQTLAINGAGQFWVSDGDQLFRVDSTTGQATPGPLLDQSVAALASRGDRLFAVRYFGEDDTTVFLVDTGTGALSPILEGAAVELPIADATFDAEGRLWLTTALGGSLIGIDRAFVRIDLETGITVTTLDFFTGFTDPLGGMSSLAMRGNNPAIEVPTLDHTALMLLILLVAVAGAFSLTRRARATRP